MSTTLIYRQNPFRDFMNSLAYFKRRIMAVCLLGVLATVGLALVVRPLYRATSSVLVLLGTEYTYRGVAGQQPVGNGALTRQQILQTEADIQDSDDLRRMVIRQIGLDRVYPELLKPATGLSAWIAGAKADVERFLAPATGGGPATAKPDPMTLASNKFGSDLSVIVDRDASVIDLGFRHRNPEMAAEALRVLEADYLDRRRALYDDVQSPVLQKQVVQLQAQLKTADDTLAAFKETHQIGDFAGRRNILLQQQGALETSLRAIQNRVIENGAKLDVLQQKLHLAANDGGKGARANPAAPLEGMVQSYRSLEEAARNRYLGSAEVDRARSEALLRQTDIAKLRAQSAFAIQEEIQKTDADLRASQAGHDAIVSQLNNVNAEVAGINRSELKLRELERALAVADENYRNAAKILGERRIVENVETGKQQGVRVIQPPLVPAQPEPLRRLILAAGLLITMIVACLVALLSHYFRTIYFAPEELETGVALTVLASVPETRDLQRRGIAVGPG